MTSRRMGRAELDLTLRHGDLEAIKSYVTYPGSSVIREWITFKNVGTGDLTLLPIHGF